MYVPGAEMDFKGSFYTSIQYPGCRRDSRRLSCRIETRAHKQVKIIHRACSASSPRVRIRTKEAWSSTSLVTCFHPFPVLAKLQHPHHSPPLPLSPPPPQSHRLSLRAKSNPLYISRQARASTFTSPKAFGRDIRPSDQDT
jgi:hypothetical protein